MPDLGMVQILSIANMVIAVLLVTAILLQARGGELGATFGGAGEVFRTKRGIEKFLFIATIILAFIFFGLAFTQMILAIY